MRTLKFVFILTVVALVGASCTQKPVKSIENLKKAITGETGANAKYTLFAKVAQDEGYINISKLFTAAAAAEAVHIKNHNAVLVALGEPEFKVTPDPVTPGTTAENLKSAIEGETYETTTMYPEFTEAAKLENCTTAVTTFTWAKDSEKKHADTYTAALNSLVANGNDSGVSATWYICPKCGNLYDSIASIQSCELCGTKSSSFQQF
jgi:rubrerythrin